MAWAAGLVQYIPAAIGAVSAIAGSKKKSKGASSTYTPTEEETKLQGMQVNEAAFKQQLMGLMAQQFLGQNLSPVQEGGGVQMTMPGQQQPQMPTAPAAPAPIFDPSKPLPVGGMGGGHLGKFGQMRLQ